MDLMWTNDGVSLHSGVQEAYAHGGACNIRGRIDKAFTWVHFCCTAYIPLFKPCAPLYRGLSGNHSEIPHHHRPSMSHSVVTNQSLFRHAGHKSIKGKSDVFSKQGRCKVRTAVAPVLLCALPPYLITSIQTHVRPCNPLRIGLIMAQIKRPM